MNIKEHIEAGHYPKDEKGRALVPGSNGETYTILCTDMPGPSSHCIAGFRNCGMCSWPAAMDENLAVSLLPPPPRKVKVTLYALIYREGAMKGRLYGEYSSLEIAKGARRDRHDTIVVELSGEYEEPYS